MTIRIGWTVGKSMAFLVSHLAPTTPAAPTAAEKCPADSVLVGEVGVDKYETSLWEREPTNATLIKTRMAGAVTEPQLLAGGAIRRGVLSN